VIKKHGKLAGFFRGGNSTCRTHIRKHYNLYSQKCEEQGIEENERCVPPEIARAREKTAGGKGMIQMQLDTMLTVDKSRNEFSREAILKAVTQLVACTDMGSVYSCRFSQLLMNPSTDFPIYRE
jgi:hypothetical protein